MKHPTVSPAKFQVIPFNLLETVPQVRTKMDKEALTELADDMRTNGVLEPILVRKVGTKYRVIAGHRRTAAAQIAELDGVPAIVKDASDEEALMMQLSENLHREELSDVDQANAVRRLFDHYGTLDAVAAFVGKSKAWCSKRLALTLASFSWRALRLLEDGITEDLEIIGVANQVDKIAPYDKTGQRPAWDEFVAGVRDTGWTREQCREFIRTLKANIDATAELAAAKAKVAAANKKERPKAFKAEDALQAVWFDVVYDRADGDPLAAYTPEQLDLMADRVHAYYAQGKQDVKTARYLGALANAVRMSSTWRICAYMAGVMGITDLTLKTFCDSIASFQTETLLPPPSKPKATETKPAEKK